MVFAGARLESESAGDIAPAFASVNPLSGLSGAGPSRPDAALAVLVETQIIPRLMRARPPAVSELPTRSDRIVPADIDEFAPLAISGDAERLLARAEHLLDRGVQLETLLLELLVPAARRLGVWWEEDRCDFVEVTMGLWRLQQVTRELCARVPGGSGGMAGRRRALFAPIPGDQHGFGAVMVDEIFRRHGWASEVDAEITLPDLLGRLGGSWFDIVGLTVSCDSNIGRLSSIILAMRSVSRNPRLRVMIGGRACLDDQDLAMRVGADGSAVDARQAVQVADEIIDALAPATLCA